MAAELFSSEAYMAVKMINDAIAEARDLVRKSDLSLPQCEIIAELHFHVMIFLGRGLSG